MPPLIDKLLFMIDRCQSEPAGYSLFSSQVASNTLFYVTFNVKSAQPLVECGAVDKMISITRKLLFDNDSNTPLRWVCHVGTFFSFPFLWVKSFHQLEGAGKVQL